MGMLVVRELQGDGKQEVYFLNDEGFTLYAFQMWMFGVTGDGRDMGHAEVNEIVAYYPNAPHDDTIVVEGYPHLNDTFLPMWYDPEGLPRRYSAMEEGADDNDQS